MPALTKKFGKNSPLEVLRDIRENEGRGIEEAIRRSQEDEEEAPPGVSDVVVAGDVAERIAAGEEPVTAVDGDSLPTLISAKGLRYIDDLTNGIPGGLTDETAEYLVVERVAALWDVWIKGEDTAGVLAGEGGYYFNLIRERFASERKEVEALPVPEGWSFTPNGSGEVKEPLPMQKRTAWEVLTAVLIRVDPEASSRRGRTSLPHLRA